MIALYIVLGLLIITFLLSLYITRKIFFPKTYTRKECKDYDVNKGFFSEDFLTDQIQEVSITNDGLKLHAQYVDNHSDKTIILMHGYTSTLYGIYKYLTPYLESNFNILMPDQRYHGKSEGKNTTLGYKEHTDLHKWISYAKELNPNIRKIGLHGESMGAVTCLLEGHNENIDFLVSDCSYATFKRQIEEHLWIYNKMPKFFVYPASFVGKILFDAPILPIKPIENVKNISAPILLIHGSKDTYISPIHFHLLKEELKSKDKSYLCEGANHAQSYETDPLKYNDTITKFLQENNII